MSRIPRKNFQIYDMNPIPDSDKLAVNGIFRAPTPYLAAKKVFTHICRASGNEENECEFYFCIKEEGGMRSEFCYRGNRLICNGVLENIVVEDEDWPAESDAA
jgi:hypothetical protein